MNFNYCPNCGKKDTVRKQDNTNYECADCGWHFWNNTKAATTLVLVKNGKMLVNRRAQEPRKGMYDLLGGFVDFGETAQQGVIREAKEELNITIAPDDLQLVAVYSNDYNPEVYTTYVVFLVTKWQGEFTPNEEIAELDWKPFDFVNDPSFCQKFYTGLDKELEKRLNKSKK